MKRRLAALAVIAAIVMPAAAQCGTTGTGPYGPFTPCPAGTHKMRIVTNPFDKQWACVR